MKCKIIFERDPKTLKITDKIKAVKAPNGQKSILFDDIRSQVIDDKLSLETYYKTYTDEFKDKVKGVGKDKNDEVIFEEVKDIILPSNLLNKSVIKESDRIIWGHPALGKTTALETNPNLFIDWDVEFNSKRDKWIEDKSGTIKGTPEYKKARNEYLINYNKYPDYIQFVTNEWNKAKQKAKRENKKLLASPHMLLNLFPNDFDKIINISDDVFMERAVKRSGGDEINSRLWKEGINKTLENVDKSKVITTDKYLSDLLPSRMLASVEDDIEVTNYLLKLVNDIIDTTDYFDTMYNYAGYSDIQILKTEEDYLENILRDSTEFDPLPEEEYAQLEIDLKNIKDKILNYKPPTKEELDIRYNRDFNTYKLEQVEPIINDLGHYLSEFTSSDYINSIIDLIKTNDPDNIELAKQLIKGIIENPGLYSSSGGTQSNNIRSKYFADNDTQSHRDILQKIVDSGEGFNPLAKKLLTINSKNIPITLKSVDVLYSFTDNFGNKRESVAMYQNGRIEMSEFGNYKGGKYGFESTVIHEILHAFTYNELRLNSKNAQELKAIYQEALKYKDSFSDQYSISDIDEFLVAIFTNANFIKDIQKIPSIYPEKHQSLWEDVLEFFKKWFQFNNKEASLLDDAFYIANKILIDYSNDPNELRHKEQLKKEWNELLSEEYVWTDDEGNPLASPSEDSIKKVILPIGTSGSGKSSWIKSLPKDKYTIISPDEMRVEFTGNIDDKSKDKDIYEEVKKRTIQAVNNGKQVIIDSTNLQKERRRDFLNAIKDAIPDVSLEYKLMPLNPELAKKRIKAQIDRGEDRANVPDSTIDRHAILYKEMLEDIKDEPITQFTDDIVDMPEFKAFNKANPNTTLEENLAYYKQCKL